MEKLRKTSKTLIAINYYVIKIWKQEDPKETHVWLSLDRSIFFLKCWIIFYKKKEAGTSSETSVLFNYFEGLLYLVGFK